MRIATFNANSIRVRLDTVLSWLSRHEPDVLCLQETKVTDELFPREPFLRAGYHVIFKGQKAYNGVAIVSKREPMDVSTGLDDEPPDDARLIRARIGDVTVVNTYVPQGRDITHDMYRYKIRWFDRLRAGFDRRDRPDGLLFWVGDINVAAEPIDVHNPEQRGDHVCYHVDARNAFARCRAWGFEDVFRKHHPEPGQFTFFDFRTPNAAKRGLGWRIDYILATARLAATSRSCFIDMEPRMGEKPSDHTFLVADFDLRL